VALTSGIIPFLLLCRSWLFFLILFCHHWLLGWDDHEIVFKGFGLMSCRLLNVAKVLSKLLLWVASSISHYNFSIIDCIVPCIRRSNFADGGRLILILLVCTQIMVGWGSSIEIVLLIFLFKILYFLKYLLWILNVCLLQHPIRLYDLPLINRFLRRILTYHWRLLRLSRYHPIHLVLQAGH